MFLTFNKSDDANRVQDILSALAWLHQASPKGSKVGLVGVGKAAIWCEFAAAVALSCSAPVSTRMERSF